MWEKSLSIKLLQVLLFTFVKVAHYITSLYGFLYRKSIHDIRVNKMKFKKEKKEGYWKDKHTWTDCPIFVPDFIPEDFHKVF